VLHLHSLPFTSGRSRFLDHGSGASANDTAKVYVKIGFEGLDNAVFAQLDTGAAWSVLPPDIARTLGLSFESTRPAILRTWLGRKQGSLIRMPFTFLADEGEDLPNEGTFFVTPDWPEGLTFLGYSGLLDSIRFALDPQVNDFYFGP
jgi:hypothetical protein